MKFFTIVFTALILTIGCNEASLKETAVTDSNFITINVDSPVVAPGDEINISLALDNGTGTLRTADIQIGNHVFADSSNIAITVPVDISQLFGDEVAKQFRGKGYVDVPIKVKSDSFTAQKYFRIMGSSYEKSLYDTNPSIDSISYTTTQNDKTEIDLNETLVFNPNNVPDKINFTIGEVTINKNIKDNFIYSWHVFGTGTETPQVTESDELEGSVAFSFKDSSGAPLIGTYRFYLVLKPSETYSLSYDARYCNDFVTFTVDTAGNTKTVDEEPDTSETDDSDSN